MVDVAYLIDPRFPGGTSSAIAHELRALAHLIKPTIYAITSNMFSGEKVAPQLDVVLQDLGLTVIWNPQKISADVVILHNPSFLKFQKALPIKIITRRLFVVTHENFNRSADIEAFDVRSCLDQIDSASLASQKIIAPISTYNRQTVKRWLGQTVDMGQWDILEENWFNICTFDLIAPATTPEDRRGRLSRAGFEKFPNLDDLELCFPEHAQSNVILGANNLMYLADEYPHWKLLEYREVEVVDFFKEIDFLVYFTSPSWRESFGRVLAEAIAAGKMVISDPGTASTFGDAVIGASPEDVDQIVAHYIKQPDKYQTHIRNAQASLQRFSAQSFSEFFQNNVLAPHKGAL